MSDDEAAKDASAGQQSVPGDDADRPGATRASSAARKGGSFLRELAIVVVAALLITSMTRAFVMQPFIIPSGSMENTLIGGDPRYPDDRVMAIKFGGFDRGDIVVFEDYAHWLTSEPKEPPLWKKALEFVGLLPDSSKNYLVKRVIGLPGDKVTCCTSQGQVEVNGVALDESAYLYRDDAGKPVKPSDFPFEVVVPAGRIFVMGDHRNASADSRCHLQAMGIDAFVPVDKVSGPVKAVIMPTNRWQSFEPPATFASVPAPAGAAPAQPTIKADQVRC